MLGGIGVEFSLVLCDRLAELLLLLLPDVELLVTVLEDIDAVGNRQPFLWWPTATHRVEPHYIRFLEVFWWF